MPSIIIHTGPLETVPPIVKLYAEDGSPEAVADPKPVPGRVRYCRECKAKHPGLKGFCGRCLHFRKVAFQARKIASIKNGAASRHDRPLDPPGHEERLRRMELRAALGLPLQG